MYLAQAITLACVNRAANQVQEADALILGNKIQHALIVYEDHITNLTESLQQQVAFAEAAKTKSLGPQPSRHDSQCIWVCKEVADVAQRIPSHPGDHLQSSARQSLYFHRLDHGKKQVSRNMG